MKTYILLLPLLVPGASSADGKHLHLQLLMLELERHVHLDWHRSLQCGHPLEAGIVIEQRIAELQHGIGGCGLLLPPP